MNENYSHPEMPKDKSVEEGILKGMYLFKEHNKYKKTKIQLLGSGTILREMIAAAEILQKDYQIDSNVWSVTSFNELRKEALEVERYNLLHPDSKPKKTYIEECLSSTEGPVVAASDYMRLNSDQIRSFTSKSFYSFGTDGYGRSDTRKNLRKFFEVDKEHNKFKKTKIQLLGSGAILREMIAAAEILQKEYQIDSNVWSVTSFNELRKEGLEVERYNLLNPDKKPKKTYIEECLSSTEGPVVAASDYMRLNSDQIRSFTSKSFYSFGTDGYGRSDTRKNLRKFFEVDKEHIVTYSLSVLAKEQLISSKYAKDAMKKYKIDPEKPIPTKL